MKNMKRLIAYTTVVFLISLGYFFYVRNVYSVGAEQETVLREIGEGLGGVGLWLLLFLYARTILKLCIGKGGIAQRIIPEYSYSPALPPIKKLMIFLNKTHKYVGIATVMVIVLHVAFMGLPMDILFFPFVLVLII